MPKITRILGQYQLTGPYPQDQYVRRMKTDFGRDGLKFMDLVDSSLARGFTPEEWRKIYNAKNRNADLSLYVSSHSYSHIYREVLHWLGQNVTPAPDSFVDLGCENGLLTLCLAEMWPGARASGIDRVDRAISVARLLAKQFANPDVSFSVVDLAAADGVGTLPPSSLALGAFLFHELMDSSPQVWDAVCANLDSLIDARGRLITINRFPNPRTQVPMLNKLLSRSELHATKQDEIVVGWETFPIVVYDKR